MSLKEFISKEGKEEIYSFYQKIQACPKDYEKITRNEIYHEIITCYQNDPEWILKLCNMEEIHILKKLLDGPILKNENGYIDYLLMKDLQDNYLILLENGEYYIPDDLINYIKMAINLLDEKKYSISDVTDSVILGIVRVNNVLSFDTFIHVFNTYCREEQILDLKKYIKLNPKFRQKIEIIRYQKVDYIVSREYYYFKEVLKLRTSFQVKEYSLEEIISFGKYKLNLFQENILYFLNFLEVHLNSKSIDLLIDDLAFYSGFHMQDDVMLLEICDHIEELYNEVKKVISYFPDWIYTDEIQEKEDEKEGFFLKVRKVWSKLFK